MICVYAARASSHMVNICTKIIIFQFSLTKYTHYFDNLFELAFNCVWEFRKIGAALILKSVS